MISPSSIGYYLTSSVFHMLLRPKAGLLLDEVVVVLVVVEVVVELELVFVTKASLVEVFLACIAN